MVLPISPLGPTPPTPPMLPPDPALDSSSDTPRRGCGCGTIYLLITTVCVGIGLIRPCSADLMGLPMPCGNAEVVYPALPWVLVIPPNGPFLVIGYLLNFGISIWIGRWLRRDD